MFSLPVCQLLDSTSAYLNFADSNPEPEGYCSVGMSLHGSWGQSPAPMRGKKNQEPELAAHSSVAPENSPTFPSIYFCHLTLHQDPCLWHSDLSCLSPYHLGHSICSQTTVLQPTARRAPCPSLVTFREYSHPLNPESRLEGLRLSLGSQCGTRLFHGPRVPASIPTSTTS